ncbi:MAG: ComF family protein [bacterium]
MFKNLFRLIVDFLFPSVCLICGRFLKEEEKEAVCPKCWAEIQLIHPPWCERCGLPLAPSFEGISAPLCRGCREGKRCFHQARAVGIYEGILRKTIHLFKFGQKEALARLLGGLMAEYPDQYWPELKVDFILPVPLHRRRLRSRGFNQAELLSKIVSLNLNLPLLTGNLLRTRFTIPQIELTKEQRLTNLKGAFKVRRREEIEGRSLLLIDDVFTTGATMNECSRALLEAGAAKVYCLALARPV